jgi:hypothetical protein
MGLLEMQGSERSGESKNAQIKNKVFSSINCIFIETNDVLFPDPIFPTKRGSV